MLLKLKGGSVYDPANSIDGMVRDIYVRDGRIVAAPSPGRHIDHEYELAGKVVMAGRLEERIEG